MRNGGSRLSRSGRRWRGRSGSWRGSAARSRPRARAPHPAGAATATPARRRGGSRAGRGDAGADACAPCGTTSWLQPTRTRAGRHEPAPVRSRRTSTSVENEPSGTLTTDMIVDVNPFVYSRPISPEDVVDRDEETRELLTKAVGGHYVRLYGPRKFGKTSLLKRVLRDGERQEGLIPILVDLYRVVSIADVTIRVERAYARQLKGPLRARVEELLQRTGLGLSLGAYGIGAKLQLDPKAEPLAALHALLDLPT